MAYSVERRSAGLHVRSSDVHGPSSPAHQRPGIHTTNSLRSSSYDNSRAVIAQHSRSVPAYVADAPAERPSADRDGNSART